MSLDNSVLFRQALGQFATGVCVVTARIDDRDVGITINSFTSVSLEPPLILWCLDCQTDRATLFSRAERFAIHVLGEDQKDLSNRYSRGEPRLDPLHFQAGDDHIPFLPDPVARFVCQTHQVDVRGDHYVVYGKVISHQVFRPQQPVLTYFRGAYGQAGG